MIEDSKSPHPKYKGMVDGVRQIVQAEGLGGIYRGLVPVVRGGSTV